MYNMLIYVQDRCPKNQYDNYDKHDSRRAIAHALLYLLHAMIQVLHLVFDINQTFVKLFSRRLTTFQNIT